MNENEKPVFENEARPGGEKKHDKKSLVVFFSFVAALALLVGLNMK
ncbi:MAG TPA: hypothetical protein VGP07_22570 [Polyangia bacterium]|jgi:hypothetical protein